MGENTSDYYPNTVGQLVSRGSHLAMRGPGPDVRLKFFVCLFSLLSGIGCTLVQRPNGERRALAVLCKDATCAATASEFHDGDAIYVRLPPSDAATRIAKREGSWTMGLMLRIDDKPAMPLELELPSPNGDMTGTFALVCDAALDVRCVGTREVAIVLSKLGPGAHRILVDFDEEPSVMRSSIGAADISLKVGGSNAFVAMAMAAKSEQTNRRLMPAAAFADKSLEAEMMELARRAGIQDVRRVVFFRLWNVSRHPVSGLPISRETDVSVASGPENGDPKTVCRVTSMRVVQANDGERFGPLRISQDGQTSTILCEHIDE